MIGACGPYNLGGSVTGGIRADHYQSYCSITLQKFQNDLGQIILSTLVQIASDLSLIHPDSSHSFLPFL